jgi:putative transposase
MARLARVIAVGVPHHVTQRGNARQYILSHDADRSTYLVLVRRYCLLHKLAVLGYCLRSNHVHLIVIPSESHSLAQALKQAHGRYATHWNVTHGSSGHVWQGRFYSCPLDAAPLWMALRYSERNPVRAGLVDEAHQWAWSSAAIHCGAQAPEDFLDLGMWRRRWTVSAWRNYLSTEESEADLSDLRRCTHTGRPLGSQEFIAAVEKSTQRQLVPQKGGRPVSVADNRQGGFPFEQ